MQSSLSNGDKGRSADYLSNGKKRKVEEKEFMTDYVSTLRASMRRFIERIKSMLQRLSGV